MPSPTRLELGQALQAALPQSTAFSVPLSDISRWRIGGEAHALVEPRSVEEVAALLLLMRDRPEPLVVVGDMSNVLFDSAGFRGVVLRIGRSLAGVKVDGRRVRAEAGIGVPELARLTADHGLGGLEHTVGIPGTIGGLVTMNGGSQRRGVGDNIVSVTCLDRTGQLITLSQRECKFAYRSSSLQDSGLVVVGVELNLEPGSPSKIHADMDEVIESRKSRFPEDLPNCGSTFLSDPKMYGAVGAPGRAIESAGLKGFEIGGAQISTQHANFVVNTGTASSADVLAVIRHARQSVREMTGFAMDCEVRYISPEGEIVAAHVAAERADPAPDPR